MGGPADQCGKDVVSLERAGSRQPQWFFPVEFQKMVKCLPEGNEAISHAANVRITINAHWSVGKACFVQRVHIGREL
jgi:hypothetical protein